MVTKVAKLALGNQGLSGRNNKIFIQGYHEFKTDSGVNVYKI